MYLLTCLLLGLPVGLAVAWLLGWPGLALLLLAASWSLRR